MHILLVEPDSILGQVYTNCLQRAKHHVAWAQSAQSAVHLADSQAPDVVILELQLLRHNGVEFLYEFRSYPEWRSIPIVLHTAVPVSALQSSKILQHELGVTTVLYKPATSLDELLMAVQAAAPARV